MTITVTNSMFHDAFNDMGRGDQFSYEALNELFRYYEETEDSTGENMELDVIAICCEWTEHDTNSIINDYAYMVEREEDWDDDDYADAIIDLIRDEHTTVIPLGGYEWLVMDF